MQLQTKEPLELLQMAREGSQLWAFVVHSSISVTNATYKQMSSYLYFYIPFLFMKIKLIAVTTATTRVAMVAMMHGSDVL